MHGKLFIIAAPSGAGKTSLVKALLQSLENIEVSVSYCTRAMRPGEQEGVDYHFVSPETFESMAAQGAFLEHARVFDRCYGTSRDWVVERLKQGVDIILEIDWQGARQVREAFDRVVSIFILPPSRETLAERLQARGQDDADTIERRMRDAITEMSHYGEFDYLVVNEDFSVALQEVGSIIRASRLTTETASIRHQTLIRKLLVQQ